MFLFNFQSTIEYVVDGFLEAYSLCCWKIFGSRNIVWESVMGKLTVEIAFEIVLEFLETATEMLKTVDKQDAFVFVA